MGPLSGGASRLGDGKAGIVARVIASAERADARVLRGGGTVFAFHRLISPRVSPHTAFIVDPARLPSLVASLRDDGWMPVHQRRSGRLPPAVTVMQLPGGRQIHLHGVIPGFFVDPAVAFASLWNRRARMTTGEVDADVLDRLGTIVFAMHHRLDGSATRRATHSDFFLRQFEHALTDDDRRALAQFVDGLGAGFELQSLAEGLELAVDVVEPSEEYTRARSVLTEVTAADRWLLDRLEGAGRMPPPSLMERLAASARLLGAPRRARSGLPRS